MTVALLTAVARHLYGGRWKTALAADIALSNRQVSRWANEGAVLPEILPSGRPLTGMLIELLEKHQEATEKLIAKLQKIAG
jgi:hypothetical protein